MWSHLCIQGSASSRVEISNLVTQAKWVALDTIEDDDR